MIKDCNTCVFVEQSGYMAPCSSCVDYAKHIQSCDIIKAPPAKPITRTVDTDVLRRAVSTMEDYLQDNRRLLVDETKAQLRHDINVLQQKIGDTLSTEAAFGMLQYLLTFADATLMKTSGEEPIGITPYNISCLKDFVNTLQEKEGRE